jgi:hypothetical protein
MAELTETVAEVAEGVANNAITVAEVSRSISGRDFSMGFVSGGFLSGLVTWLWSRKHYELKFNKIAMEEIAEMREHYRAKAAVVSEKPSPEEIVEREGYIPPERGGLNVKPSVPMPQPPKSRLVPSSELEEESKPKTKAESILQQKNVFDPEWNQEFEISQRTPDQPYVIHREEFAEINGYTGVTLTYYEGDDVLVDEDNRPVENKSVLVGDDNLSRFKFGHGSGDPHLVFIRNDSLHVDIEVIRSEQKWAEVMQGFRNSNRTYGPE